MNIDWKARFTNKATLVAIIAAVVAFVYQIAGLLGVVPPLSQDLFMQSVGIIINVLVAIGVVVDPKTPGITDKE